MDNIKTKRTESVLLLLMILSLLMLPILNSLSNKHIEQPEENLTNEYPGIMRFHVVANSDSAEDQSLKLSVRDYVLTRVEKGITAAIISASENDTQEVNQVEIMRQYINQNLSKIEAWANEATELLGAEYSAKASIGIRSIPAKYYDDIFFPAGNYEALTITLGDGVGQNWWCVVFPPLCLIDSDDSSYCDEFDIDNAAQISLKFKTEDLLNAKSESNLTCKQSIFNTLLAVTDSNLCYR